MSEDVPLPATFTYRLQVRHGRSISDDNWEEIDGTPIRTWQTALPLLKRWVYTSNEREVTIAADWQPLLTRIQQLHQWHGTFGAPLRARLSRIYVPQGDPP